MTLNPQHNDQEPIVQHHSQDTPQRKAWITPELITLSLQDTQTGGFPGMTEGTLYNPSL